MPNRILKESIKTSLEIDQMTLFEENMFYRLIVSCDDYGRYDGDATVLKNTLYPRKNDIRVSDVEVALEKMAAVGVLERYEVSGRPYVQLTSWSVHQRVRNSKKHYPEPPKLHKNSASPQIAANCGELRQVSASCGLNPIQSNPIQSNARATDADNFDVEEGFGKTYELWPNRRSPAMAKQNYLHKLLDAYDKKTTALLIYNAVRLYLRDYENNHADDEAKRYVPSFDKWLTNDCDYWITEIEKIKERANE